MQSDILQQPLFQHIITHAAFEDNTDEVTFLSPVCLTGAALGAVRGSAAHAQQGSLSFFARDLRTPGSGRFTCLYEGLQQPATGVTSAPLQGFITNHVVLRGKYQTVPVSLFGFGLDQAAGRHVQPVAPPPLSLETALHRFPQLVEALDVAEPPIDVHTLPTKEKDQPLDYETAAKPALETLLIYWKEVGASPRKIAASPLPTAAAEAVAAAADAVCITLAAGESVQPTPGDGSLGNDTDPTDTAAKSELIDMVLGWLAFLGDTRALGAAASPAVLQCGISGLAAAVLICTHAPTALSFLSRHGLLLLEDVLRAVHSPGSFHRHASAASLLLTLNCGALACEALLGWWRPTFVQWRSIVGKKDTKSSSAKSGKERKERKESIIPQVDGAHDDDRYGGGGRRDRNRGSTGDKKKRRGHHRGEDRSETTTAMTDSRHRDATISRQQPTSQPKMLSSGIVVGPLPGNDRWDMDGGGGGGSGRHEDNRHEGGRGRRGRSPSPPPPRDSTRDRSPARGRSPKRHEEDKHREERRRRSSSGGRHRSDKDRKEDRHKKELPASGGGGFKKSEGRERERAHEDDRRRGRDKKDEAAAAGAVAAGKKKRQRSLSPAAAAEKDTLDNQSSWHEERDEALFMQVNTRYWEDRLREYAGIYSPLATVMVELRPKTLAAIGGRLLRILRFYERASSFTVHADELVKKHESRSALSSRDATEAGKCGVALAGMAETLAAGTLPPLGAAKHSPAFSSASCQEADPLLLELLESRGVLARLPGLLQVPLVHYSRALKEESEGASTSQASAASAAMANQLALGITPLLSVLASSLRGLKFLASKPVVYNHLVETLQAIAEEFPAFSATADALCSIPLGFSAIEDFCSASIDSEVFASSAHTIQSLLSGSPAERTSLVLAASLRPQETLNKCLLVIRNDTWLLKEASGMRGSSCNASDTSITTPEGGAPISFERLLDIAPILSIGEDLLAALAKEVHGGVVMRWIPHASALIPPLSAEIQELYECGTPLTTAACTRLGRIKGFLEPAAAWSSDGVGSIGSLIRLLEHTLPQFEPQRPEPEPGMEQEDQDQPPRRPSGIWWADVREFWDNPVRRGTAESALRLLCSALWQPGGRDSAAAAHTADGMRILQRAVVVGTEAVAASQADRQWVSRAGAAIDPAASFAAKRAALEFLDAASAATSAFLQHLRSMVAISSSSMASSLIEAHGVLSCDEGCILLTMGVDAGDQQHGGAESGSSAFSSGPAASARCNLTSALRCWIEAPDWTPKVLNLILEGPLKSKSAPGARAMAPRQIFTATFLLGDLLPDEWPLPGRRATQPPPSVRKYRAALANSIEGCQAGFEQLLRACTSAEPLLLRAAAVRLLARASGLGGGMGPFIMAFIVEDLAAIPISPTPIHDARKLLEMMVPLIYRPAIKSALLDTTAPASLARIIAIVAAGVIPVTSLPVDAADGSAVATMAVECLTVMCDPDIGLDPLMTAVQAEVEEVPPADQGAFVASVLLEHLPSLGINAPVAERVLRLMARTAPGRVALRRAATGLHARALGEAVAPDPNPPVAKVVAAAQWVAGNYWNASTQAKTAGYGDEVAEAFADVTEIMKDVCASMQADGTPPRPPPAPLRFASATQSAVAAALKAGLDPNVAEVRWEAADSVASAADSLLFDPATKMFWRNCKARAVAPTPASATAALRRYTRHTCAPDPELTVAGTLHPPLTHPVRPLEESMEPEAVPADVADVREDYQQVQQEEVEIYGGGADTAEMQVGMKAEENVVKQELQAPPPSVQVKEEAAVPAEPAIPEPAVVEVPAVVPVAAPLDAEFDLYADLDTFTDFKVNEVNLEGQVAHLTSLDPPKIEQPNLDQGASANEPAGPLATVEDIVAAYTAIVATAGDNQTATKGEALTQFLTDAQGHKDDTSSKVPAPVTLDPLENKDQRRSLHQLFKNISWLPPLRTDVSESNCIEVSVGGDDRGKQQAGQKRKWRDNGSEPWTGGAQRYVRFALYKENMDTQAALGAISKTLHFNHKVFGWAGTKDKRAITVQWVTAFKVAPAKLARINSILRGIRLGNFEYCNEQLRLGDLRGNQFDIILRGLSAGAPTVAAAAAALKSRGFVNYFGLQRFGSSSVPTHAVGISLMRGQWEEAVHRIMEPSPQTRPDVALACRTYLEGGNAADALRAMPHHLVAERAMLSVLAKQGPTALVNALLAIPRNLRTMYLHAYQSVLWNEAASKRIEQYGSESIVAGDLVLSRSAVEEARRVLAAGDSLVAEGDGVAGEGDGDGEVDADQIVPHVVTEEDVAAGKYSIDDLVLPLPGKKVIYPENDVAKVYHTLAARDGVSLDQAAHNVKEFSMAALSGAYRHVMVRPGDMEYEILRYDDQNVDLASTELQELEGKSGAKPKTDEGKYLALRLKFVLPSSTYATMLIRELTKMPTNVEFSKALVHPQ